MIPWLPDKDADACDGSRRRCSAGISFSGGQKTCRGAVRFIHKSRGMHAKKAVTSADEPGTLFQLQHCRHNAGTLV